MKPKRLSCPMSTQYLIILFSQDYSPSCAIMTLHPLVRQSRRRHALLFFFGSIIFAFSPDYDSALFYLNPVCRPAPRSGSMAAPSPPLRRQIMRTDRAARKLRKGREAEPALRKLQMKPDTRSPRVTTPHAPPLRPPPPRPPPPPPLHPHCPNFPPPGSHPPDVGASQEVQDRRAAPLIRQ